MLKTAIQRLKTATASRWASHRKQMVAGAAIVAVLAIVAAGLLISVGLGRGSGPSGSPGSSPSASPSESPTGYALFSPGSYFPDPTALPVGWEYSDLDGVGASADLAHRLPLAVMIADNAVSRPQSGISTASIVYQAYADGGEDRYMMIWQEGTATDIGPARSARPYYVYWAAEYKPLYGHVGGDAHSLQQVIPSLSSYIYNMDELNGGSCPFHRITQRAAPQNDYTNSAVLISCASKKGYPETYQKLPTRPFRDDITASKRPSGQVISIPYRTGTVGYKYQPATDNYLRIVDGSPEVDPANSKQVFARTIVVMYQSVGYDPGSIDETSRPWVSNVGSGDATIYLEGKAITATWKKASTTALTRYYDSSGTEIQFVRGEIFMQSVPPGTSITLS